jgi:hypothetical protein
MNVKNFLAEMGLHRIGTWTSRLSSSVRSKGTGGGVNSTKG